jgi:hypothetical protein
MTGMANSFGKLEAAKMAAALQTAKTILHNTPYH